MNDNTCPRLVLIDNILKKAFGESISGRWEIVTDEEVRLFDTTLFSNDKTYGKMLASTPTHYGKASLHVLHGQGCEASWEGLLGPWDRARIIKQMQKLFEASAVADATKDTASNLLCSILETYGIDRAVWTDTIYYPWTLIKARTVDAVSDVPIVGFGVRFGNGSSYEYCFNPDVESLLLRQNIKLNPTDFNEFFEAVRKHLVCCQVVGAQRMVGEVDLVSPITDARLIIGGTKS